MEIKIFHKPRKSLQHKRLEALSKRMLLSTELKVQLKRFESGHKGELLFYKLLETYLSANTSKLFDLTIIVNGSICQIDSLLFFHKKIFIIEIKHYAGDFIIKGDEWYSANQTIIKNPLHQLKRTEILLKQLLEKFKLNIEIKPLLIFTHPEFHLINATQELPIVFPTQLKRFIKMLNTFPHNLTAKQQRFITTLHSLHQPDVSLFKKIQLEFDQLNKGLFCVICNQLMEPFFPRYMCCPACQTTEKIDSAIKRSIAEYHLLFPKSKVTINQISNWINHQATPYYIKKALSNNWTVVKKGRSSHYVPKKY